MGDVQDPDLVDTTLQARLDHLEQVLSISLILVLGLLWLANLVVVMAISVSDNNLGYLLGGKPLPRITQWVLDYGSLAPFCVTTILAVGAVILLFARKQHRASWFFALAATAFLAVHAALIGLALWIPHITTVVGMDPAP